MKHYVCRPVTEIPKHLMANVRVNEGIDLTAGEAVVPEVIDTGIDKNYTVYITSPVSELDDDPALVLNDCFETLEDGRRPDGNPDYTTYIYRPDDVVACVRLIPELRFEIGTDNWINSNEYIQAGYPSEGYLWFNPQTTAMTYSADLNDVKSKYYLVIETAKILRSGATTMDINSGEFSPNLIHTVIARVKCKSGNPDSGAITAINASVEEGLTAPVEAGTKVLTMTPVGGVAPITYEMKTHETLGADNALFAIAGNTIVVGENPLAGAKTYKIYVEATDSKGHTYDEGFDIPVTEA